MSTRLESKNAILTGAAGGIGLAVADAYLHEGSRCTVADIHTHPTPELAALMREFPDSLHYVPTDVRSMQAIDALIAAASSRFGPVTTLFNNAAIFDMAPLLESDEAMYDKLFAINVKGTFFVMKKSAGAHGGHPSPRRCGHQYGQSGWAARRSTGLALLRQQSGHHQLYPKRCVGDGAAQNSCQWYFAGRHCHPNVGQCGCLVRPV